MGGCFGEVGVLLVGVCFGVEGCKVLGVLEVGGRHGEGSGGMGSIRWLRLGLDASYARN